MALVTTRSLVLQAFPYSETSKVLRLFTWEHGLRSVIAKGALRPRSRFGGVLEPFTEGAATFYLKEGRDLHTLSGFELVRSRQALGRSLARFAGASLLAELALRLSTEEPHPRVYAALAASWDAVADADTAAEAEVAVLTGAWTLAALLGFAPQLEACVLCGRAVGPAEAVRFAGEAGGIACTRCRPAGRVLDAATRAELASMLRGDALERPLARPGAHRALLRAFLELQLAHDRPFRSLDLFLEQAKAEG
ncbi:MAG TPA: DNA repair protein RecO [Longimicrobiaceae bacterium]|nr:DNA repair protein RecO [Longimicrobiaceae bacterium]